MYITPSIITTWCLFYNLIFDCKCEVMESLAYIWKNRALEGHYLIWVPETVFCNSSPPGILQLITRQLDMNDKMLVSLICNQPLFISELLLNSCQIKYVSFWDHLHGHSKTCGAMGRDSGRLCYRHTRILQARELDVNISLAFHFDELHLVCNKDTRGQSDDGFVIVLCCLCEDIVDGLENGLVVNSCTSHDYDWEHVARNVWACLVATCWKTTRCLMMNLRKWQQLECTQFVEGHRLGSKQLLEIGHRFSVIMWAACKCFPTTPGLSCRAPRLSSPAWPKKRMTFIPNVFAVWKRCRHNLTYRPFWY